jgi:thiamine transport system permease protein
MDPGMDTDRTAIAAKRPGGKRGNGMARLVALAAFPAAFLAFFLFVPFGTVLFHFLFRMPAGGLMEAIRNTDLPGVLAFTAGQALLSTLLTLLLGVPAAYVIGGYGFPGRSALLAAAGIPFVMPTVVVGSAFVALLGPGGALGRMAAFLGGPDDLSLLRSLPAVVLANVFYNISVVVKIVGGFRERMDPRLREAAWTLGASRPAAFFRVSLPLLSPAIAAAGLLVFSYCFTAFATILILGAPWMSTLETEIYRQAVNLLDFPAAALLSLTQLIVVGSALALAAAAERRLSVSMKSLAPGRGLRRPEGFREKLVLLLLGVFPVVASLIPLLVLAMESLRTRSGPGFLYWRLLFSPAGDSLFAVSPLAAIGHSLLFAAAALVLSLAVGLPAAAALSPRRRAAPARVSSAAEILFLLPLGVSAVTLGFGFLLTFNRPPLDLRGSAILIPIAHALTALPLVARSLLPAFRSIPLRLKEAASALGAGPLRAFGRIVLPLAAPSVAAAAGLAFAVSLGEFAATSLLARPDFPTLPILIYRFLTLPGDANRGRAMAAGTLLMIVCGIGFAGIERLRGKGRR